VEVIIRPKVQKVALGIKVLGIPRDSDVPPGHGQSKLGFLDAFESYIMLVVHLANIYCK
jgi:hypothetical protein